MSEPYYGLPSVGLESSGKRARSSIVPDLAPGGNRFHGSQETVDDSAEPGGVALTQISLPTAGGAIRGIEEKLTIGQPTVLRWLWRRAL